MSEYIIQGETLSALADEVRTLSGTSDEMSIDTMKGNLQAANTEIDEQAEKLDELEAAIDELPEAGGSGVNPIYKIGNCNFTIETMYEPGLDLCRITFDDASINLSKCVELYMYIRFESTSDRYSEIFMRNTKSIGGKFDRLHSIYNSNTGCEISSWINFAADEANDDKPIELLYSSGRIITEITYEALMVE